MIVLAWRNARLLGDCLAALARQRSPVAPFETIVVLNGAASDVVTFVQANVRGARIVSSAVNLGFGGGCNLAARAARGEYLVLLNDDAAPDDGWLHALVETADTHPDAGAVGSRVVSPDGPVLEAGSVLWRNGLISHVGRGLPASSPRYRYLRRVDYCSASSLLIRRSTWESLGGFDEGYFPGYYEDVDLCLSIARLGQVVLYEPRSRLSHRESSSLAWGSPYKDFVAGRNRARFVARWSDELPNHPPPPETADAMEWAVQRARRLHRRALLINQGSSGLGVATETVRLLDPARQLAGRGYAVFVMLTGDRAPTEREDATVVEELGQVGVAVVDGDLEAHLRAASALYDVVLVGPGPDFEAISKVVRRHQPLAAIVSCSEGPLPPPGTRGEIPEAVVPLDGSPPLWQEVVDAARRERLARLRWQRRRGVGGGQTRSG